jgi:hypothetical protein
MTDEHAHGERETDDMADLQTPITQAEVMATIRRVADGLEAMEHELLGRSRPDSDDLPAATLDHD